jgi:hypothetical protein
MHGWHGDSDTARDPLHSSIALMERKKLQLIFMEWRDSKQVPWIRRSTCRDSEQALNVHCAGAWWATQEYVVRRRQRCLATTGKVFHVTKGRSSLIPKTHIFIMKISMMIRHRFACLLLFRKIANEPGLTKRHTRSNMELRTK